MIHMISMILNGFENMAAWVYSVMLISLNQDQTPFV